MRLVIQRVSEATVRVDDEEVAAIGPGFLVLVGIEPNDDLVDVGVAADKITGLRLFADEAGLMNRSVLDTGGEALIVSQFTLMGDARKGRRPSFSGAASPEVAAPLIDAMSERLSANGVPARTGRFGAKMDVSLVNDGPVTLVLQIKDGRVL